MNYPPPHPEDDRFLRVESFKPAQAKKRRFPLADFDQIKPSTASSYTVKGLLTRTGLAIVWGAPKCGKSFWVFDLVMHVALGRPYRGLKVKQGLVVYCALEGAEGFKARVDAFRKAKLKKGASAPFKLMSSPLRLVADAKAFVTEVREQTDGQSPAVVVLDTLNRSITGSESEDKDMGAYIEAADVLRDAFDCLVVIVHHCGHEGTRPRGHSSLGGALDVQISVKRDAADNILAELEIAKDLAPGLTVVSRLQQVEVDLDDEGDPITSCIIQPVEGAPFKEKKPKGPKLPKGAQIALRALHKALDESGAIPPASNHIPARVKAVTIEQWRTYAFQQGICTSDDSRARRMAFQRATDALVAAKAVAVWEPYVWTVG